MEIENLIKPKIHIVPVGYEYDRIVIPLKEMEAKSVWLISQKGEEKKKTTFCKAVEEWTIKNKIEKFNKYCEINDLYDCMKVFREIVEKEKDKEIYINLSTGTKIEAIAGMIISMMYKEKDIFVIPYYVIPKYYAKSGQKTPKTFKKNMPKGVYPESYGIKKIFRVPRYKVKEPNIDLIKALKIIEEKGGEISKKDFLTILSRKKIINIKPGHEPPKRSRSADHVSMRRKITEPLEEWGFIKKITKKNKIIKLTDEGKSMAKIYKIKD